MRKVSDMQRIINFGLDASAEGLQSAIEALQVIKASRYPKTVKAVRKQRVDKGNRRTPPPAPVGEPAED